MSFEVIDSVSNVPYGTSRPENRPWWFWVLVGCGMLFFCCICFCIVSFGGLLWLGSIEPENVIVTYEVPHTLTLGSESRIDIYIENTDDQNQTVNSLRVDFALLDGFDMLDSNPTDTIDPTELIDSISYHYNVVIEAGGAESITLFVMPDTVGDFSGEIMVCFGAGFACEPLEIQFEVIE